MIFNVAIKRRKKYRGISWWINIKNEEIINRIKILKISQNKIKLNDNILLKIIIIYR